jgi:hypothetical protein
MDAWMKWVIVVAGLVAVLGHWVTGYWLDVIGGVVAAVVGLMLK